ncbi:ATP-binding protein [Vibrio owensii]|uniref:ATP-binding protein n=1 Tax=Vibrio owensii TaxID=696485 RepID=UPI000597164F|nr:transporter substrate-binding domain-containing protein [Vibrio owensii]
MYGFLQYGQLLISLAILCFAYSNDAKSSVVVDSSVFAKTSIVVAVPSYAPVPYHDAFNDDSIYYDILFDLSEKLNLEIEYREFDSAADIAKAVANESVDLAFGFSKTPELNEQLLYSLPVLTHHIYSWFHDENSKGSSPTSLKWGCINHSLSCREMIHQNFNTAVVFSNPMALVDALSNGAVDAALVSSEIIDYHIQTSSVEDWVGVYKFLSLIETSFITSRHNPELMDTLNNYLSLHHYENHEPALSQGAMMNPHKKQGTVPLKLRYSVDSDWFPMSYIDKSTKKVTGYIHELLALYSQKTGVHFEYVEPIELGLEEMLSQGHIDFYPITFLQGDKLDVSAYTLPFLSQEWVKVKSSSTSEKIGVLGSTNQLLSKLKHELSNERLGVYSDFQNIKTSLQKGDIGAALLPLSVATAYIYYSNSTSLGIDTAFGNEGVLSQSLFFKTKPSQKRVVDALNAAISKTNQQETDWLMQKHQPVSAHHYHINNLVTQVFIALTALVSAAALVTRQKYVRLSLKANERKERLQSSTEQLLLLNTVIEHYPGMIAILNERNETVIANQEFKQCYQGCINNKCLNQPSCCGLLSAMMDVGLNELDSGLNINKDICPIDGKFYKIHKEWVNNEGNSSAYQVLILTDITSYQAQQKQIDASRLDAIHALKARDAFLAMISHELRTPLAAIMGVLDLLNSEIKQRDNRELFLSAQSSASRLNLLVNDILDFSKIEAGQMQLDPTEGCIFDELSPQLRTFEAMAKTKKIEFLVQWCPTNLANANFDWSRLNQVVNNIISNAIKFTKFGSVVVKIQHSSSELQVFVRDSGCGMTKEQLTHIYHPFIQADHTISRRFGGSGLGMSIVKNLVDLMSGTIAIDSEYGIGTTVDIRIPIDFSSIQMESLSYAFSEQPNVSAWLDNLGVSLFASQQNDIIEVRNFPGNVYPDLLINQLKESDSSSKSELNLYLGFTGTVLVADDDPINRLVFQKQLCKLGVKHVCVNDGKAAYEYLRNNSDKIDLLLTDCHMPLMDGYELTEAIRNDARLVDLPIIGCTAEDSRMAAQRAERAGMNTVIYKPYSIDVLAQVIKNHVTISELSISDVKEIDWLDGYDAEEQSEIVNVLAQTLNNELELLQDYSRFNEVAHRVKGTASILGLKQLEQSARACEAVNSESLEAARSAFVCEIQLTQTKLTRWLSEHQQLEVPVC